MIRNVFIESFNQMATSVHLTALSKGWWQEDRNDGEIIALCHSELSEALEALRNGNPPDRDCPDFDSVSVELADCIIRIMDLAHKRGFKVAEALVAKAAFNLTRPHKHGGKKF